MNQTENKKTDLRVVKTMHALNTAFTSLLGTTPLEAISINDLCAEAGIRRATFYKHFNGKDEFVNYALRRLYETYMNVFPKLPQHNELDAFLLDYAQKTMSFLDNYRPLLQRVQESTLLPTLLHILAEGANETVRERLLQEVENGAKLPASPEMLTAFYVGGLYQIFYLRMEGDKRLSDETILSELSSLLHTISAN